MLVRILRRVISGGSAWEARVNWKDQRHIRPENGRMLVCACVCVGERARELVTYKSQIYIARIIVQYVFRMNECAA